MTATTEKPTRKQKKTRAYAAPKGANREVRMVGEHYHLTRVRHPRLWLVHVNADHWKGFARERLATPVGQPGSITLFDALTGGHDEFIRQLTAERPIEEFKAGKGLVTRWETIRRKNHYLDAYYAACAAGHYCGARLIADGSEGAAGRRRGGGAGWFAQRKLF